MTVLSLPFRLTIGKFQTHQFVKAFCTNHLVQILTMLCDFSLLMCAVTLRVHADNCKACFPGDPCTPCTMLKTVTERQTLSWINTIILTTGAKSAIFYFILFVC